MVLSAQLTVEMVGAHDDCMFGTEELGAIIRLESQRSRFPGLVLSGRFRHIR